MAPAVAVSRPILCALVTIMAIATSGVAHADDAVGVGNRKAPPQPKPANVERRPVAVIELVDEPEPADVKPAIELTPDRGGAIARSLRDELARHDALRLFIDPIKASLLTGEIYDNEDSGRVEAVKAVKEAAENALAQFDFSVAHSKALEGLDRLNLVTPSLESIGLASDLATVMGQTKLGENDPKDATRWFALVHRLTPKRRLDPARFLPEVVAAFDQATPVTQLPGALEVHGSRGRVFIDGVDVGVPNATFEVSPGWHLVQIAGPERVTRGVEAGTAGMPVDVPVAKPGAPATSVAVANADASEEIQIKRARAALAHASDPAARAQAMKHLAMDLLKVSDAILVLRLNGKLVVQAWRDHAPGFDAPIFNTPVEAAKTKPIDMLAWLSPPRPLHPIDDRDKLPPAPPAWYEKRWVQASAVSAVLVFALGGYLYSLRGGGMNSIDSTIHMGH